jgi:putative membrane protein
MAEITPDVSTILSMRRTGMSFQRTRLSADRTLMSVIRTSISLISFGFTIFQFFGKLKQADTFQVRENAPRNFGSALVWLGILMLVLGIAYHLSYMSALRKQRDDMKAEGLIYGESQYPVSMTLVTALGLLAIGILAILSMQLHVGPFG